MYAFNENFVLPLSHDEVVHGKGSLLGKMPGDDWQKFANLRLLFALHVGAAGQEAAVHGRRVRRSGASGATTRSLDWHLLGDRRARRRCSAGSRDLNRLYRASPRCTCTTSSLAGFEWIDANDDENSVFAFLRSDGDGPTRSCWASSTSRPCRATTTASACRAAGVWRELLNTDAAVYGGSGLGNLGRVTAELHTFHGRPVSLRLTLPPLSALYLVPDTEAA